MDVPLEALEYSLIRKGLKKRKLVATPFLEVGCGDGYNLERFSSLGMRGIGIDVSREALTIARSKKMHDIAILECDFLEYTPIERSAVIFMLNILEHIESDRAFIQKASELLLSGEYLVIATPTRSAAYGFADVNAGHVRRYEKNDLLEKLRSGGFEVEEWLSVGFPVNRTYTWIFNFLNRHRMGNIEQKTILSGIRTKDGYYGGFFDVIAPIAFPILTLCINIDRLFVKTGLGNNCVVFARKK